VVGGVSLLTGEARMDGGFARKPHDREVRVLLGISLLEFIVVGTACIGVPLLGAGIVVAIAMPLRSTTTPEVTRSVKNSA
jgi:translation initiation factor 6 (eIF-6)